jgi:Lon protease-like protein
MPNFDHVPLFPLYSVLFPDMQLPLYIFEPRYREMIQYCREHEAPFGIVLLLQGNELGEKAIPSQVGAIARMTQFEELTDGTMNIVVVGETRFRLKEVFHDKSYLTANVDPIVDEKFDVSAIRITFETVSRLFRAYIKESLAVTNRSLSSIQLPQDPESLSFAVATMLQVPVEEKQYLLELKNTEARLKYEIDLLVREIDNQKMLGALNLSISIGRGGIITPVNVKEMSKLISLN